MKNIFKNLSKRNEGFTLIELLIVIAVLGSLAGIVVVRFTGAQSAALDTKRKSELRQYQNALEIFATRNNSAYHISTSTIDASSMCTAIGLTSGSCPNDPKFSSGWQNYRYQSNASGTDYVLWVELEKDATGDNINHDSFVLCSDGQAGIMISTWTGPTGGVCPNI